MKAKINKTVVFVWLAILVGSAAFWVLMVWFVLWLINVINNFLNGI